MKAVLVTMNVKAGRCEENFCYMKERILQAKEMGADLIIFPQNAVSGYLLGDIWLDEAWCRYVDSFNERLTALSEEIAIVWGNIRYRNRRRFNAAFFAYQKRTSMRVKRHHQASYAADERYFEENAINAAIEFRDMVLALNFHEELQLADLNINLDAQPYEAERRRTYRGSVLYVNACGIQECDGRVMLMEGGSYYVKNGELQYHGDYFSEEMRLIDTSLQEKETQRKPSLLKGLVMGIREIDHQLCKGKKKWCLPLSNGLDSAVVCALLVYALGKERVLGDKEGEEGEAFQTARLLGVSIRERKRKEDMRQAADQNELFVSGACRTSLLLRENMPEGAPFFIAGDLSLRELLLLGSELNTLFANEVVSDIEQAASSNESGEKKMLPEEEKWEKLLAQDLLFAHVVQGGSLHALLRQYKATLARRQLSEASFSEGKEESAFVKDVLLSLEKLRRFSYREKSSLFMICVHQKGLKDIHRSRLLEDLALQAYQEAALKEEILLKLKK